MPFETWRDVTAIALVDAINFPVMFLLIFVLGRPRALSNGLAYSIGMLGTHFAGGLVFAAGISQALGEVVAGLGPYTGPLQIAIAGGLVMAAAMMPAKLEEKDYTRSVKSRDVVGWFFAGFAITMTKLPIAILYATAVNQIVAKSDSPVWVLTGLVYYNILAFLPFFWIWAIWLLWRRRSRRILWQINDRLRAYAAPVMKYGLLIVSAVLVLDGFARTFDFPTIF